MLSFTSPTVSFSIPSLWLAPRFYVFCVLIASSTPVRNGGLAGVMAALRSIVHRCDQPSYPVLQHIERYGAHILDRRFATMYFAGDAK